MCFVVSGRNRVYVLVLFRERVGALQRPRLLVVTTRAMDLRPPADGPRASSALCRLVVALRVQRVLWGRLIGLSFLVLDATTRE